MSEFNIEVNSGDSIRLPVTGKYCDRDIVVSSPWRELQTISASATLGSTTLYNFAIDLQGRIPQMVVMRYVCSDVGPQIAFIHPCCVKAAMSQEELEALSLEDNITIFNAHTNDEITKGSLTVDSAEIVDGVLCGTIWVSKAQYMLIY